MKSSASSAKHGLEMALFSMMHGPLELTLVTVRLTSVVALSKRLFNLNSSTFSEGERDLGGELETELVIKTYSSKTYWLNIALASCTWLNWAVQKPPRENYRQKECRQL